MTTSRTPRHESAGGESKAVDEISIVQNAIDCIISIDHEGRIIGFNPAAEHTFGHSRADLLGRELVDAIIPPSLRERHRQGIARYLATGEARILNRRVETTALRADGTEFPVELTVTRVPRDGEPLFTAFLRDITERVSAEAALREREERYELVLAGAGAAIWDWDVPGKRVAFSPRWKELRGLADDEVSDSEEEWSRGIHPADKERVMAAVRAHFEGQTPVFAEEYRIRHKDGHWLWILDRGIARRDATGQVIRMAGSETDITERKQAEAALKSREAELEVVANSTPLFLTRCNRDLRYLYVNRSAAALFGLTPDEMIGRTVDSVLGEKAFATIKPHIDRVLQGEQVEFEAEIPYAGAGHRWMRVTYVPETDENGEIAGWIASIVDITDRKRAENTLEEADRRKNEFLATLAHELRNPLAPVRNALQILHMKGPATPELQWAMDVIDRQVQQMTRLIDDLMDVNRISRNRLELRRELVELASVVKAAIETSHPVIDERRHDLTVVLPPDPVILDGDQTRLAQVFSNLLNNAAKYTPPGGQIQFTAERTNGELVVSIRDTGKGIAPNQLAHVFDMFSHADYSPDRDIGGLGIGLSLAKRLVEMHGGTIEARSEGPGSGSEFILRLPIVVEASAESEPPRPTEEATPNSSLRILIADDNRDSVDSLEMMLRVAGNETRTACDGQQAVEVAEEFRPELALLDIGMPNMNGFEACRQIRQQPWGKEMTLIALTGWGQESDLRRSMEAGFDHHLVKPVDPQQLLGMLAQVSSVRSA